MINKVIIFILIMNSCSPKDENRNKGKEEQLLVKEAELLKKELELKEHELQQAKSELGTVKTKEVSIPELYKNLKKGVFLIYTQDSNSISQGTGFFVDNSGTAISNYHVFKNADKAIVILDNNEKCMISKILDSNSDLDYIIFKVEDPKIKYETPLISDEIPEIGATCFAIGNPKGLTQTLSIGNISGLRDNDNLIQITTEITHGSSGGPLFDKNGRVIGITTSGYGEANLNFAIRIGNIPFYSFISSNDATDTKKPTISIAEIKNLISAYYFALNSEEYSKLFEIYTSRMDRYFSLFNIASSEAINFAKNYKFKYKILNSKNIIKWETLDISVINDDAYYVTFNMDYFIDRVEKHKPSNFNIDIIMIITSKMKIRSIYENIINSTL
ncbi:MAG: serine protease [Saprospiraceae bacterium]